MVFEDGKIAEFPNIKKIAKILEIGKCPRGWQLCLLLEQLAFISIFAFIAAGLALNSFLLYPMRSMGESIGIGLAASSPSKGPQAKTTEHMDTIKVTYCSIQLG